MEIPDKLNLDVLKIVNRLYDMRFFIAEPHLHAVRFNKWLYLWNENHEMINKEHFLAIRQFSHSFLKSFTANNQLDSFFEKLLGEEVGKNTHHSGLLQNRPQPIYYFLINSKNKTVTEFLINNLHNLDAAFNAWQSYKNQHSSLTQLIRACKNEIDKKSIRNATLKMTLDITKAIQPTLDKSKVVSIEPIPHRPPITLSHPEELPILKQLIQKIYPVTGETLLPHTENLINLRNRFNALTGTNHLIQLFLLDECIIRCFMHNYAYSEKKLMNSYFEILSHHLLSLLTPYSAYRTSSPQAPGYELDHYLNYTKKIMDLGNIFLRNYFSFSLAHLNLDLMALVSEITQQKILEEDDIIDPDAENDLPNTQELNATQIDDNDVPSTQEDRSSAPPSQEHLQPEITTDGVDESAQTSPSKEPLKRKHSLDETGDIALAEEEDHDKPSQKKSRFCQNVSAVNRRVKSDLPEQIAHALERRGLFNTPLARRCKSSPEVLTRHTFTSTCF